MNIQNLEIPILQAPIEATANLTAAVSNTGGMGSLGLAWEQPDTAGGLADKDDVNWALHEGATAVMLGTRFVATQESDAHPLYKDAILAAKGSDTVNTTCYNDGWPNATHRVIRNQLFNSWESAGCPQPGSRPGENLLRAEDSTGYKIRKYAFSNPKKAFPINDVSDWCLYAGLGCDRIKDVPSVTELIDRLWSK